jgi:hypothetical protein
MVTTPTPFIRQEREIEKRTVRSNDNDDDDMEMESSNAPCKGDYHSINGCTCYKATPCGDIPWKFRNRRNYLYNYTLEHYRKHDHCTKSCGKGCSKDGYTAPRDMYRSKCR